VNPSSRQLVASALVLLGSSLAQVAVAADPAPLLLTPEDLSWTAAPASLPPGALLAVLEGDPTGAGPFTLRLKLPANYRIPPHTHGGDDEQITVLSGTFYLGLGERPDPETARAFPAGSFLHLPATSAHYAFTRGEVVVQLHGEGPFVIEERVQK
jgi:hypothetical protein